MRGGQGVIGTYFFSYISHRERMESPLKSSRGPDRLRRNIQPHDLCLPVSSPGPVGMALPSLMATPSLVVGSAVIDGLPMVMMCLARSGCALVVGTMAQWNWEEGEACSNHRGRTRTARVEGDLEDSREADAGGLRPVLIPIFDGVQGLKTEPRSEADDPFDSSQR